MSPCLKMPKTKQDVMVQSCNTSIQKIDTWGLAQVEGQSIEWSHSESATTYNETMSQNTNNKNNKI